jgi:hypothetical protein
MLARLRRNWIEAFIDIFIVVGITVTSSRRLLVLIAGAVGISAGIVWRMIRERAKRGTEKSPRS